MGEIFLCILIHVWLFFQRRYREWLIESGFEPVRVELIPKDMTYSSREDFAAWIRTTWLPWMARLPESGDQDSSKQSWMNIFPVIRQTPMGRFI